MPIDLELAKGPEESAAEARQQTRMRSFSTLAQNALHGHGSLVVCGYFDMHVLSPSYQSVR